MLTKQVATYTLAALLATSALAGAALAADTHETSDAAALQGSKISLSQAIAAAEQQTGGKAFDAGVDNENGKVSIAVQVNTPKGMQTVLVDPQSGQVTGTQTGNEQEQGGNEQN